MPLYRFDVEDPSSGADRETLAELSGPPREGQAFSLPDIGTVVVTGFVPVPPDHVEAAGHEGIVKARFGL